MNEFIRGVMSRLKAIFLVGLAVPSFFLPSALAGRGLGSDPEQAIVLAVKSIKPAGLKLAKAIVQYNDGDRLSGVFRIYCPTGMIRPTNYKLVNSNGQTKKTGSWWEPAFKAKWKAEKELVDYTCNAGDFGFINQ